MKKTIDFNFLVDKQFNENINFINNNWILTKINFKRKLYLELSELNLILIDKSFNEKKDFNKDIFDINIINILKTLISISIIHSFKEYELQAKEIDSTFSLSTLNEEELFSLWSGNIKQSLSFFLESLYEKTNYQNNDSILNLSENTLLKSILFLKNEENHIFYDLLISFFNFLTINELNINKIFESISIFNQFKNFIKENSIYRKNWIYKNNELEDILVFKDLIINENVKPNELILKLKDIYVKKIS